MRCVDAAGHGTTWTGLRAAQVHRSCLSNSRQTGHSADKPRQGSSAPEVSCPFAFAVSSGRCWSRRHPSEPRHGADVNARAAVDRSGFGGHTPIFNCVMTSNAGRRHEVLGRLLLDRGADPNARASIGKRLAFARDSRVHEYRNVTPRQLESRRPPGQVMRPGIQSLADGFRSSGNAAEGAVRDSNCPEWPQGSR
jgi:hypothetical protein